MIYMQTELPSNEMSVRTALLFSYDKEAIIRDKLPLSMKYNLDNIDHDDVDITLKYSVGFDFCHHNELLKTFLTGLEKGGVILTTDKEKLKKSLHILQTLKSKFEKLYRLANNENKEN